MSLLSLSHSFPRHRADDALNLTDTLADTIPNLALDVAEHPDDTEAYQLTWFFDADHADGFMQSLVQSLQTGPLPAPQPVDDTIDYVAATRAAFPPLTVGPFFIARNDEVAPEGALGLNITPNRAFGSGEHATTRGCLESYLEQASTRRFANGLDVGTGSAILALAAGRYQSTPFIGTDIDAPSVVIAQENATLNGIDHFTAVLDEDLSHVAISGAAPFDLIFANILMTPLIELAPAMAIRLAPAGILILSGFTTDQQSAVHAAYTGQGLTHKGTRVIATHGAEWCASTFTR